MTRIYLIRHAEAEGNLYRRAHGWYDGRVTENGKRQISALSQRFADVPVDAVYASDLRRTQATAQAVAGPKGLEVHIDPGLREIGMGVWEDRTFGDLARHEPEKMRDFYTCAPSWQVEGCETFEQVRCRITPAIFRIARENEGKTVAIFSHGSAIHCFQASLRDKKVFQIRDVPHCGNTGVTCLDIEGMWHDVKFENDVSHLPDEIATLDKSRPEEICETWFENLDMDHNDVVYYEARKDAWQGIHGSFQSFDGPGFLGEARDAWLLDHRAVQAVMLEDKIAGVLQLDVGRDAEEKVGYVPFLYLKPEYRCKGIGVQLIGQAVCTYRAMGREKLRLRCAPDNGLAQRFYKRNGFHTVGMAPGARVPLELLEKEI